jgi:hypothetical protein
MTVNYADSTIDHFNLESFYYGCVTGLEESITAVVVSCTVTVTGKDMDGNVINTQSFPFTSNGGLEQDQTKAVLSGFTGLYSAEFTSTTGDEATDLLLATLIDTVSYTVYSTSELSS